MFQWLENLIAPAGYRVRKEAREVEENVLKEKIVEANIAHTEAADGLLKSAMEAKKMGNRENRQEIKRMTDEMLDGMKERRR